jgi:hypothetical protein
MQHTQFPKISEGVPTRKVQSKAKHACMDYACVTSEQLQQQQRKQEQPQQQRPAMLLPCLPTHPT